MRTTGHGNRPPPFREQAPRPFRNDGGSVMARNDPVLPKQSRLFAARRLTLMALVATLVAVLLTSPGSFQSPSLAGSPAVAAETVQQGAGFADLVARVKPAVVSVRVKFEAGAA